jgi:hypothetical protein
MTVGLYDLVLAVSPFFSQRESSANVTHMLIAWLRSLTKSGTSIA